MLQLHMTHLCRKLACPMLGRRTAYRIGRALYQRARGEAANDIASNGEAFVQKCVVDAWKKTGPGVRRLVAFDVGANVGDWSLALLGLLPESATREAVDLYIFEPVPTTFEFLKNRLGIRDPSLHYEQIALSSEEGEGTFYVHGQNAGTNSLYSELQTADVERVSVPRTTAALFCQAAGIQHVHLLKCDTEGHDMEVIRGALPLLASERVSVLQFEYNHRWVYARRFLRDAFTAVEGLPYRVAKLQPDHLLILTRWHPELERFFEGNYALVHREAMKWFPTLKEASFDRFNAMHVENR